MHQKIKTTYNLEWSCTEAILIRTFPSTAFIAKFMSIYKEFLVATFG